MIEEELPVGTSEDCASVEKKDNKKRDTGGIDREQMKPYEKKLKKYLIDDLGFRESLVDAVIDDDDTDNNNNSTGVIGTEEEDVHTQQQSAGVGSHVQRSVGVGSHIHMKCQIFMREEKNDVVDAFDNNNSKKINVRIDGDDKEDKNDVVDAFDNSNSNIEDVVLIYASGGDNDISAENQDTVICHDDDICYGDQARRETGEDEDIVLCFEERARRENCTDYNNVCIKVKKKKEKHDVVDNETDNDDINKESSSDDDDDHDDGHTQCRSTVVRRQERESGCEELHNRTIGFEEDERLYRPDAVVVDTDDNSTGVCGNGSIRNFRESPSGLHYIDMEDVRSYQMDAVVINVNNNSTGVGGRELDTIDDDYGDMPDLVELGAMDDNSIDDEVSRLIKQEIKVSSSKENEADGFTRPLKGKKIELGQNGTITGVPVDHDDGGDDDDVPDMILPDEGELERLLYSASELGKTLRDDEEKITFVGWLEKQGFVMNDDNCSMSKLIKEKKCTMFWHVNDVKVSHEEKVVLDEITSEMADEWKRQKEGRE